MIRQWMAVALMACAPWAAAQTSLHPPSLGSSLADEYISPAFEAFHAAAGDMRGALTQACKTSDALPSETVSAAFGRLVAAWSGVEFLRFGPLVDANRFERINFWPDPRGMTTRQVQSLLAKPSADMPNAQSIASHSVAVQGLPALEYVLYRDGGLLSKAGDADRAPACAYAVSVAGNLQAIAGELSAQWKEGGEQYQWFSRPSADNALYRSRQEVAAEAVKALSTGLQFQTDVKLGPALGSDPAGAQARKAPFWRSGFTVSSIEASVRGMLAFYQAGHYQYSDAQWIDQNIQGELQRAADHLAQTKGDISRLSEDQSLYQDLVLARLVLKNAKDIVDQDMAPALGVRIGFNALDGD